MAFLPSLFSLEGQVAVVTGGTGVLGRVMAHGLARAGAKVRVLGRRREQAEEVAHEIEADGGAALALPADVLDRGQLEGVCDAVLEVWGASTSWSTRRAATCRPPRSIGGDPSSICRSRAWTQ